MKKKKRRHEELYNFQIIYISEQRKLCGTEILYMHMHQKTKQQNMRTKEEINKSTSIAGNFNTPF